MTKNKCQAGCQRFGSNLGPIAAKLGPKPGTRTQNKAKRTNKIDFVVTLCKQGVAGSIPVTSTKFLFCFYRVSCFRGFDCKAARSLLCPICAHPGATLH